MALDLNKLSDQELEAIANGDLESLSDQTLEAIAGSDISREPSGKDYQFSLPVPSGKSGFVQRGVDYVDAGLESGDAPAIGFEMLSKILADFPRNALQKPMMTAMAGPLGGAGGREEEANFVDAIPQPVSKGGEMARNELGTVSAFVPAIEGLSAILNPAKEKASLMIANSSFGKSTKGLPEFAEKVRGSMFAKKSEIGKGVDEAVTALSNANPDKSIDLSGAFNRVKEAIDDAGTNPGLASDIKSTIKKIKDSKTAKLVSDLIEDPQKAKSLTLRESEDIKRAVQNSPRIASKLGNRFANWEQGDIEILDLLDEIKLSQSDEFKDLAEIRKPYAEFMRNYREVKNLFKPKSLDQKITGKFGNRTIEKMVEDVLPEDIVSEIAGVRNVEKAKDLLKKALIGGLGVSGAIGIGKAID